MQRIKLLKQRQHGIAQKTPKNRILRFQQQENNFKLQNQVKFQKRLPQKIINTDRNDRQSQQRPYIPRNMINRMNSQKALTYTMAQIHGRSRDLQNLTPKNKRILNNQQKILEHKKLTDKIGLIEQKVQQMKNDLMKKKQEKQRIIKQQIQQRQRWHRQRYLKVEEDKSKKQIQREQKREDQKMAKRKANQIKKQDMRTQSARSQEFFLEQKQSSIMKDLVIQMPEPKQVHQLRQNPYSPRSNIYYVSEIAKFYKDQKSLTKEHIVQSLQIMRTLQNSRMPLFSQVQKRRLNLKIKKQHLNKKTLIFDMDQTLIHCNDSLSKKYDVKVGIKFQNGTLIDAGVNIRPYAKQILKNLHKDFQIIIFTASQSCYADEVLNVLDPHNQYIAHRLYRQHCFLSAEGMYIKDLRIINRLMGSMILVDNAAYSYYFQLQNGIPIIPYYQGTLDYELKQLQRYLSRLVLEKDVRKMNKDTFQLHRYSEYYNTPTKLVQELYINGI